MTDPSSQRLTLTFELGTHDQFLQQMQEVLPGTTVIRPDGRLFVPLAQLTERVLSDPTMALLDAWAATADVISFYQDRILNEGYLPNAVEQRSVALLGRMLSFSPAAFIAATTPLALFVEPGQAKPVTVPAGTAFQGAAAGAGPAPVFETSQDVTARLSLNRLTPLQTKAAALAGTDISVLLQGTGLGLSPGDTLLLVRTSSGRRQWLRMTVTRTKENPTLGTTEAFWGSPLASQWAAAGTGGAPPTGATDSLVLYTLRLTCKLFGYNAPSWSSQSTAAKAAATPAGRDPSQYTDWPGFGVDPGTLDLQAVYSKVLPASSSAPPDSVLLIEDPGSERLGTIAAVTPAMVSAFGMSGQVTRVTLDSDADVYNHGYLLRQPRHGHTATALPDGKVLIVGGMGPDGATDSVDLFDPATLLLTARPPLPAPRAFHTATLVGNRLFLLGGSDGQGLADDVLWLSLDDDTQPFTAVPDVQLPTPRAWHQSTALPDGRIMVSGGCTEPLPPIGGGVPASGIAASATDSVTIYDPASGRFGAEARLRRARAAHTATLCSVHVLSNDAAEAAEVLGHAVVFVGGCGLDGESPAAWADAEITLPWPQDGGDGGHAGTLVPELFPIAEFPTETPPAGSGRYHHRATVLPAAQGVLLSGGQDSAGKAVGDSWAMCCYAELLTRVDMPPMPLTAVPAFFRADALATPRHSHVAAGLPSGQVAIAGGIADDGRVLDSVEVYSCVDGQTIPAQGAAALSPPDGRAPLAQPRAAAAGAALGDGTMFLCGGQSSTDPATWLDTVQLYDPTQYTFVRRPGPILPSLDSVAPLTTTALADGTLLLTGHGPAQQPLAWTFDPATGLSTLTAPPGKARAGATATLLRNNTVLLTGGLAGAPDPTKTAEIYDPRSRSFHPVFAEMSSPRAGHSATLLSDGTVLLAGGVVLLAGGAAAAGSIATATADLFDPASQSFLPIGTTLPAPVYFHAAARLANGDVLITGGVQADASAGAAIYSVAARGFAPVTAMAQARALHTSTLLPDGRVLIAGGAGPAKLPATEIFDPARLAFTAGPDMLKPRCGHAAVLLADGRVLMIGGDQDHAGDVPPSSAEMVLPEGPAGEGTIPIPVPLPPVPADIAKPDSLVVQPVPLPSQGILAFGAVHDAVAAMSPGMLFVLPPVPPEIDARRQALVFTQSQLLAFARPIDTRPVQGKCLVLAGVISDLQVGGTLLVTGRPPLALVAGEATPPGSKDALAPGTPLMVISAAAAGTATWWSVQTANGEALTIETTSPDALSFLAGDGKDIGNIPPSVAAKFTRPVQGEMAGISQVTWDGNAATTTLIFQDPLRLLYDRTTMAVYGNVVDISQGATVAGEILGSGDGTQAFQTFMLKQAPLTFVTDPAGGIKPALSVFVSGVGWTRTASLSQSLPTDRHYQLTVDAQGRAQIGFGDGVHGLRLTTGTDNVTATYRVGAGPNGNVPAGSLTRAPARVAGIHGVLNPLPAGGGIGGPSLAEMRRMIPLDVQDLGRIVTLDDFRTFLLTYAGVGLATVTIPPPKDGKLVPPILATVTLPDGSVPDPDSDAFRSLTTAVGTAMPVQMTYKVLPVRRSQFKLQAKVNYTATINLEAAKATAVQRIRDQYAAAAMRFDQAVRAADLETILNGVAGLSGAMVTALWVPGGSQMDDSHILAPQPASDATDPAQGAEILSISDDSDAIALTCSPTPEALS